MDLKYIDTIVGEARRKAGQPEDHFVELLQEETEELTKAIEKMEENVQAGCRALRKLETVREALKEKINSLLAQQELPLEDD